MHFEQLPEPFDAETPLGRSVCRFLWMPGGDALHWGCQLTPFGEIWWWRNHQIRIVTPITDGAHKTSPIEESARLKEALRPHRARHASLLREWNNTESER